MLSSILFQRKTGLQTGFCTDQDGSGDPSYIKRLSYRATRHSHSATKWDSMSCSRRFCAVMFQKTPVFVVIRSRGEYDARVETVLSRRAATLASKVIEI